MYVIKVNMKIMTSLAFLCRRGPGIKSTGLIFMPKCAGYSGRITVCRNSCRALQRSACSSNLFELNKRSHHGISFYKQRGQYISSESKKPDNIENIEEPTEKLSLFQRYKKMLKEYWYVLLPVHMVTSAFWFGGFYYAAKCGIDIVPFLEYINLPETFINPLRNSSLGYIAVASAIYKIATPARYMVTLGGTTFAIKFLTKRGLIRPAPTQAQIRTMIKSKLKKDDKDKAK